VNFDLRRAASLFADWVQVANLQAVLGKRIRDLRSKKGFSREGFADHCGLHRTYIGGIERGEHNLTIGTVMTISKGLDMSMAEMLGGIEKQVETSKRPSRSKGENS
jgi:transcriptional regulator with XRE-family HTH domain